MVVSLALSAILVGAMTGVVTLALQSAEPSPAHAADERAADLVDQILTDISVAKTIRPVSSNEIEITQPSRSGENSLDTIRYKFTGPKTKQLQQGINALPFRPIANGIEALSFLYLSRSVQPPGLVEFESGETILMEHFKADGRTNQSFTLSQSKDRVAQWFKPVLHPEVVSWKVSKVEVFVDRVSILGSGSLRLELQGANDATMKPDGNVLAGINVQSSALSLDGGFESVLFDIPDVSGLSPERGYCIVLYTPSNFGSSFKIRFEQDGVPMTERTHWLTSSNSGVTWSDPKDSQDMRFRVYGKATRRHWQ